MIDLSLDILSVASVMLILSFLYHAFALYEARAFVRRRRGDPDDVSWPPVTLLKPLAHWDEQVRRNLETFCRQEYPRYQLLLALPAREKASAALLTLAAMPCRASLRWQVCDVPLAANPKVSELLQVYPFAEHEVLVLSDADIRVDPAYIRRVVAPLRDPGVGLVTCLYIAPEAIGVPGAIEALMINVDFIPSVLVGRRLFGSRFALGATIAIKKEVLEAVGGFQALADYLADDYQLGWRVRRAGYRIAIADYIVQNIVPPMRFEDLYRHQVRWSRTIRVNQPIGWFFSLITHLVFWSALWLFLNGFSDEGWQLLSAALVFRLIEGYCLNTWLDGLPSYWRVAWLMPVKDLLSFLVWLLSFTGSRVHWAGRDYVVGRDGRMVAVEQPVREQITTANR